MLKFITMQKLVSELIELPNEYHDFLIALLLSFFVCLLWGFALTFIEVLLCFGIVLTVFRVMRYEVL